jgi:mRNA-degrading endonuclease RelE of RelBE toxin-antitoxin system
MRILLALTRYGSTGQGDVKKLEGSNDLRLRVGDFRVRFESLENGTLRILSVRNRREAYR